MENNLDKERNHNIDIINNKDGSAIIKIDDNKIPFKNSKDLYNRLRSYTDDPEIIDLINKHEIDNSVKV